MIMDWICTVLFQALRSLYIEAIVHSHHNHTGGGAELHDADGREMCCLVTAPPVPVVLPVSLFAGLLALCKVTFMHVDLQHHRPTATLSSSRHTCR